MTATLPILLLLLVAGPAAPGAAATIRGNADCGERCDGFLIYLEGVSGSYDGTGQVIEFDLKDKIFIPHLLPVLKGSTMRIGNSDPFMHNVYARRGRETVFDVSLLFQYDTLDQVMGQPGIYSIRCRWHPEMLAYWVVLDNPFFASPDGTGSFEIADVPPGSYTLVRHDVAKNRMKKQLLEVGVGTVSVDF